MEGHKVLLYSRIVQNYQQNMLICVNFHEFLRQTSLQLSKCTNSYLKVLKFQKKCLRKV